MRSAEEVYSDIQKRFSDKAGDEPGVVLGLFTAAVAQEAENIYRTIENNKTPHIWSKLEGQDLDDTEFINVIKYSGDELRELIEEGKFQQAIHIMGYYCDINASGS